MSITSTAFAIAAIAGASSAKYLESEKGRQLSSSELASSLEGCKITCEADDGLNFDTCVATQGCRWENVNAQEAGVAYTVDCGQRNYANSVRFCKNQGMEIAAIHSEEDNQAITELMNAESCNLFYIGAYRRDKQSAWKWADGSAWDYVNRGKDGLNGYKGHHESRMVIAKAGTWHDYGHGQHNHGVVCQSYTAPLWEFVGDNTYLRGCEVTCQANGGLNFDTCETTTGCQWDDGQCWSAVGDNTCDYKEDVSGLPDETPDAVEVFADSNCEGNSQALDLPAGGWHAGLGFYALTHGIGINQASSIRVKPGMVAELRQRAPLSPTERTFTLFYNIRVDDVDQCQNLPAGLDDEVSHVRVRACHPSEFSDDKCTPL